jgi:hypothetical protein
MKNDQLISKIQKQIRKNLANASEEELLDYLGDISSTTYRNKIYSRIESSKQAGKAIVLIHYKIIFDDDLKIVDLNTVKWLNKFLSQNSETKDMDVYIYSSKFKNVDYIELASADLREYGLDTNLLKELNFTGSFIDGSIFIYDKSYIYQGKLPDNATIIGIHERTK